MKRHPDFISDSWKKLPLISLPEIALIGRSNVGKSSFINALLNQKIARTSQTPGKTRTINGYQKGNYFITDLPGFGYAKIAKSERNSWVDMCEGYLNHRENLIGVFHLIDSRHPWQKVDIELAHVIGASGLPFRLVLTKTDKLSKNQLSSQIAYYQKSLAGMVKNLILF